MHPYKMTDHGTWEDFFAEIGGMQKLSRMVIGIHIPVSMQMSCSCINLSTSFYSQMLKVVWGGGGGGIMLRRNVQSVSNCSSVGQCGGPIVCLGRTGRGRKPAAAGHRTFSM